MNHPLPILPRLIILLVAAFLLMGLSLSEPEEDGDYPRESISGFQLSYGQDPDFGAAGLWIFAFGIATHLTLTGFRHETFGDTVGLEMGFDLMIPTQAVFPFLGIGFFLGDARGKDTPFYSHYAGLGVMWVPGDWLYLSLGARYYLVPRQVDEMFGEYDFGAALFSVVMPFR